MIGSPGYFQIISGNIHVAQRHSAITLSRSSIVVKIYLALIDGACVTVSSRPAVPMSMIYAASGALTNNSPSGKTLPIDRHLSQ